MAILAAAILGLLVLCIVIKAVPYSTPSSIGKIGEDKVGYILRSLPQEYHVLNDIIIPDQTVDPHKKYTTQIDHVVVSPYGIFVIETKNYSGWIFGTEKSTRWKETFKTTKGHYFYNPVKQNWGHAYALAEHLQLPIGVFKPIVVFSDDCELHVDSSLPVVYMSQLKEHILYDTQQIIAGNDAIAIFDKLTKLNLVEEEIENKHIQFIEERHNEIKQTVQQKRCPRCGGKLKLRNGKYGPFYGCSNYPRCRFTCNISTK